MYTGNYIKPITKLLKNRKQHIKQRTILETFFTHLPPMRAFLIRIEINEDELHLPNYDLSAYGS
jgi:hypothetical protein